MAFFDDLFDSITNQQATPQQTIIPTNDLLNQTYGTLQGQLPNLAAYNTGLVNATTPSQLAAEALYDPNAAALRGATTTSFLNNLNLGNQVPQELQDLITTNTLQGLGASGIGSADAGKLFGARSLLSAGLDLGRQRQMDAAGYVRSGPSLSSLFQPDRGFSPGAIAQDIRGIQAAQDEYANIQEDIRRQNFSSLINTGGRILGTAAGAYYGAMVGNPIGGAQLGGQIGGGLLGSTRVAGMQQAQQQQSGGGLGMFSNVFGSIGGPRYGIGAGQQYIDQSGNPQTSVRAQGYASPY